MDSQPTAPNCTASALTACPINGEPISAELANALWLFEHGAPPSATLRSVWAEMRARCQLEKSTPEQQTRFGQLLLRNWLGVPDEASLIEAGLHREQHAREGVGA